MSRSTAILKQEVFFISEEATARTRKIVRQDRMQVESAKCFLQIEGIKIEVLNLSNFGCAAVVPTKHNGPLAKIFANDHAIVNVIFDGIETQTLSLRKVREEVYPEATQGETLWAFETVGEIFKVERIKVLQSTSEVLQKQNEYSARVQRVPENFRLLVLQMRDWFEKFKAQIDQLDKDSPVDNSDASQEYRMTVIENMAAYLSSLMATIYDKIPPMIDTLSAEDRQLATEFIREQVGDYFYGSPFAARAYHKPRGYAGDYEMMNHLYRAEYLGRTLFDQCVHKFFLGEAPGTAVKNRGIYLADKLLKLVKAHPANVPMKIVSIASGPAYEQQMFLQNGREFFGRDISFTCIDQDVESLKHAQKQTGSIDRFVKSGFKFQFKNLAIRNIIATGLQDNDYDLIYSAGLFDYFTDPVAQMAAKKLVESLKPGGKLIIGNFSSGNNWAPLMELILDWNLIYRSEKDLERMFKGFGSKVSVEKEPLGVNLFVVIEK